MGKEKIKVLAYYLPQFHPNEINDKYWGKGFTEWTNVAKAKPLFKGHQQPMIPKDLGFYDLRLKEVRRAQSQMALDNGVYGFCYFHYWFGNGERILDMPAKEMLIDSEITIPYCFAWANHSWSNKTWTKNNNFRKETIFLEQKYLGEQDYILHFNEVLPYFRDERYIKVDNKPVFMIYLPFDVPHCAEFIRLWNNLAIKSGFDGIYFIAHYFSAQNIKIKDIKNFENNIKMDYDKLLKMGFNKIAPTHQNYAEYKASGFIKKASISFSRKYFRGLILNKHKYEKVMKYFYPSFDNKNFIAPELLPRRDRSPRSGRIAQIYYNSTPEKFGQAIEKCLSNVSSNDNDNFVFLNSWNEWGEGSFVEPDIYYDDQYLKVIKKYFKED